MAGRMRGVWVLVAAATLGLSLGGLLETGQRRLWGVAAGVTLEGRPVERLLEPEVRRLVESMAAAAEHPPVDATVDRATGRVIPARPGVVIDIDTTVHLVMAAHPGERLGLVRIGVRPQVEAAALEHLTRPLGFFTTWAYGSPGRIHNIRLATAAIHNTLLLPGQVFSFNEVVGERTWERGYRPAPILLGEVAGEGVGGGICQVSTTLYQAARRAGLRIVERHRHAVTPGYVGPGEDATVNWPDQDLKFRNTLGVPVLVQMELAGSAIVARLLGPAGSNKDPGR